MTEQPKDGGPAFPFAATDPSNVAMQATGMSLRDWFAGQAIAGACSPAPEGWSISPQDHAAWSYQIADAMLAARGAK